MQSPTARSIIFAIRDLRQSYACDLLTSRTPGCYRHCSTQTSGPAKSTLEQLSHESQSESGRRLFQKVLDGEHIPSQGPRPTANEPASAFQRALGAVGNILFYGSVLCVSGFAASRYIYSAEDVRKMVSSAEEAEEASSNAFTQAYKSVLSAYRDAYMWCDQKLAEYTEPPSDMLLPDMHPLQAQHRLRTLVLDVDGVLVQSTWNRGVGWKTFKRPGASDFLEVLCRHYELVTFSNRSHTYVDPILNRVDPGIQRGEGPVIAYRLYKNANSVRGNEHVRDLSKLNRDLSRTLFIVGKSNAHTILQQENVIVVPDWDDMDPSDRTLLDILPLLEILCKQDVLDVRVVCESYKGKDVVSEFRRRVEEAASIRAEKASQSSRPRFGFS